MPSIDRARTLAGSVAVVRVAPIILVAAMLSFVAWRPWAWSEATWARIGEWKPSSRQVGTAAAVTAVILFWFVLTRFHSGQINAIDFTVYYDRPTYQTSVGRWLFVESADDPIRAERTYFAVHAHWIMVPLAGFYALRATPLWLLALSVIAVVAGAVHTLRVVQLAGGGGVLASAAALAFALNDNTARTLNYGFHTEVLYAWFIPWMIHAGIERRWRAFAVAATGCIAVKEDAFLFVTAVAVLLALVRGPTLKSREWIYIVAPVLVALVNLGIYYGYLVPRLTVTGTPFYTSYWANYGPTAATAAIEMLKHPVRVLRDAAGSGFFTTVMPPHLYLPLVGWRWFVGVVPVVLLYGASANEQLRSFGLYYAITLVPFLVLGSAFGAKRCAQMLVSDTGRAAATAAALLIIGALVAGISSAGYSLRPWRPEIAALTKVMKGLADDETVLVQSGLYPHAGYSPHVQLLTADTLADARYENATLLLAPALGTYPLTAAEMRELYALPVVSNASGIIVARRR